MEFLTGGGADFPQQIVITTPPPPADDLHLLGWIGGVVVPLLIAIGGWYFMRRK